MYLKLRIAMIGFRQIILFSPIVVKCHQKVENKGLPN